MKKLVIFKTLTILTCSAFLAALSIVCGKYLQLPVGNVMRFSFENTPVIMAGVIFGPAVGAIVGVVADIIGSILVGYEINPIITVGAGAIGLVSGTIWHLTGKAHRLQNLARLAMAVAGAHLVGSVIIKTFGLAAYYSMPFIILMLWRFLNYAIVGLADALILYYLLKNKMLSSQINSMLRKK